MNDIIKKVQELIGKKVWGVFLVTKDAKERCLFCGGDGRIRGLDETHLRCPKCFGDGELKVVGNSIRYYAVAEGECNDISVCGDGSVHIYLDHKGFGKGEWTSGACAIFEIWEEAIADAYSRNK